MTPVLPRAAAARCSTWWSTVFEVTHACLPLELQSHRDGFLRRLQSALYAHSVESVMAEHHDGRNAPSRALNQPEKSSIQAERNSLLSGGQPFRGVDRVTLKVSHSARNGGRNACVAVKPIEGDGSMPRLALIQFSGLDRLLRTAPARQAECVVRHVEV